VTIQDKHFLPVIFHDLVAKIMDEPANGDCSSLAVLRRDREPVLAFV